MKDAVINIMKDEKGNTTSSQVTAISSEPLQLARPEGSNGMRQSSLRARSLNCAYLPTTGVQDDIPLGILVARPWSIRTWHCTHMWVELQHGVQVAGALSGMQRIIGGNDPLPQFQQEARNENCCDAVRVGKRTGEQTIVITIAMFERVRAGEHIDQALLAIAGHLCGLYVSTCFER